MYIKGYVWKFGDNINTDEIIPARYLSTIDPVELGQHCMEDADPRISRKLKKGDIIVAGTNFGCGSSREHAPLAIKGRGIICIIASSFARIFFRNAINIGLTIVESPEASRDIKTGNVIAVDLTKGIIENISKKRIYKIQSFPRFMQDIIRTGDLLEYLKRHPY